MMKSTYESGLVLECPLYIAHRGANQLAMENTLEAFELAYQSGIRAMELDLQLTRDGEVIVFHDDNLMRLAGQEVAVIDLMLSEIRAFEMLSSVITLSQYCRWAAQKADVISNFEIKVPDSHRQDIDYIDYLTCEIYLLLHKFPDLKYFISSFSPKILQAYRLLDSMVPLGLAVETKKLTALQKSNIQYSTLTLNDSEALTEEMVAHYQAQFEYVLIYASEEFMSLVRAEVLIKMGVSGVFVDEVSYEVENQNI